MCDVSGASQLADYGTRSTWWCLFLLLCFSLLLFLILPPPYFTYILFFFLLLPTSYVARLEESRGHRNLRTSWGDIPGAWRTECRENLIIGECSLLRKTSTYPDSTWATVVHSIILELVGELGNKQQVHGGNRVVVQVHSRCRQLSVDMRVC
ncbi:hypothetical protein VTK56DRAFT_9162 [Thermocarpiscus australiensis]